MDVIKTGKIFYCLLDGQKYPVQSLRISRMLLADIRSVSGNIVSQVQKSDRPQFTIIIDEFSDIVSTKEMGQLFTGFLNRSRGSGIGVIIAHQSLGDFQDGQVMKQVIDSTETTFSFVQKDPESCEVLSSIPGTVETYEKTEQLDSGWFSDSPTGRGSRKIVHEYLYHPNEFKNLNVGEAIYMAKKPSRHAKVKMNFMDIKKDVNAILQIKEWHRYFENSSREDLDLKSLRRTGLNRGRPVNAPSESIQEDLM